jgi:hypothetical protein
VAYTVIARLWEAWIGSTLAFGDENARGAR